MGMEIGRNKHGKHGWFVPSEPVFAPLLRCKAVKLWSETLDPKNARRGKLYDLWVLLEDNKVGPEEFLRLPRREIKQFIKHTCMRFQAEGKYGRARRVFYSVRSFLEYNDLWDDRLFKQSEKRAMIRMGGLKRIHKQYVPTKGDIYRMSDATPSLRDKAIILCLFQSGVRAGCLVNWKWRMFKDQLFPRNPITGELLSPKYPLRVLVTASEDTKLSKYGVGYYYTFLNIEAGEALKEYLLWRMTPKTVRYGYGEYKSSGRRNYREIEEKWTPKDDDYLFVTEGTVSRGRPINVKHVRDIVKFAAKRVGINPESIWPHVFRKAFRKTLYAAGVPDDVSEAMMGHKLPASRGNYFDYHDVEFVEKQYLLGDWGRTTSSRLARTEAEMKSLEEQNKILSEKIRKLEGTLKTWIHDSEDFKEAIRQTVLNYLRERKVD